MNILKNKYFKMTLAIGFYLLAMHVVGPYLLVPLINKIFNLDFYRYFLVFSNTSFDYFYKLWNSLVGILNVILQAGVYLTAIILIIIPMYKELNDDYINYKTNESKILNAIGIGVLLYFGLSMATNMIGALIGNLANTHPESQNQNAIVELFNSGFLSKLLMVATTVIIGPMVEELIFRKAIFKLIPLKWLALIVSSILFGLLHTVSFSYTAIELLIVTLPYIGAGIAFGYVYYKTENIYASYLLHAGLNLLSVLMILFV